VDLLMKKYRLRFWPSLGKITFKDFWASKHYRTIGIIPIQDFKILSKMELNFA